MTAVFDAGSSSSDGGLMLLWQIDRKMGLIDRMAACLSDARQLSKVTQSVLDMLRQRVFGIALCYDDCNDFDKLSSDPVFKLAADRLPQSDGDLASQPTLSRFENSVRRRDLMRMSVALFDTLLL